MKRPCVQSGGSPAVMTQMDATCPPDVPGRTGKCRELSRPLTPVRVKGQANSATDCICSATISPRAFQMPMTWLDEPSRA